MIDADLGWRITESEILKTTDGGSTWSVTPVDVLEKDLSINPTILFALDSQTSWVAGSNSDGWVLLFRRNGGQSWEEKPTPVPNRFGAEDYTWIVDIFFIDSDRGWMLCSNGIAAGSMCADIYRTENGGESWELVSDAADVIEGDGDIGLAGMKEGLTFNSSSSGWLYENSPAINSPYIFCTADGGETWQEVELSLPVDYGKQENNVVVRRPIFLDSEPGFLEVNLSPFPENLEPVTVLIVGYDSQDLFQTQDGRKHWQRIDANRYLSGTVYSVDAQIGWMLEDSGLLCATDAARHAKTSSPELYVIKCCKRFFEPYRPKTAGHQP